MNLDVRPCGDAAVLVEVDGLDEAVALRAALRAVPPRGLLDLVLAARTVLVKVQPGTDLRALQRTIRTLRLREQAVTGRMVGDIVEIAVDYNGEDLHEVADQTGLTVAQLITAHTSRIWTVAFVGFAPGFGYLGKPGQPARGGPSCNAADDSSLRRRRPGRIVQRGLPPPVAGRMAAHRPYRRASVGLASYAPCASHPRSRDPLCRAEITDMTPTVDVEPKRARASSRAIPTSEPAAEVLCSPSSDLHCARTATVLASGPLTTVQDLGRPGLSDLGVGMSGAADRPAHRLANRLVGNPEEAATLELTFGGLTIRVHALLVVALTGATGPAWIRRSGIEYPTHRHCSIVLNEGDELRIGPPDRGLRSYLAFRGGINVSPVLGSRSTDLLAGLGPERIATDDVLTIGGATCSPVPLLDVAPTNAPTNGTLTLHAVPGPRDDWFDAASMQHLYGASWEVSSESNRVGMRLIGPALRRRPGRVQSELPSEGVVRGSLQVPASGQPIVFLADHPVTGGYPVAAVLIDCATDLAAQARPGQRIHFRRRNP